MKKLCVAILATTILGCASTSESAKNENILKLSEEESKQYWTVSSRIYPIYPIDAARKGISGCIEFSFVISDSGKAQDIEAIKLVPNRTFYKAARNALKQFRWQATESNQTKSPVLTTIQLDFSTSPNMSIPECQRS